MGSNMKVEKIYSLSPMQEGMLFHSLVGKNKDAYFEQISYDIVGYLDLDCFEKSFNEIISRHEVFRTVFIHEGVTKPQQVVLKERIANVDFMDITHMHEKEKWEYVKAFKEQDIKTGFNLSKDLLIRVSIIRTGEASYTAIWSHHHIIMDGWCLGIVTKEFFEIYNCLKNGNPIELEKEYPFQKFIQWIGTQDKQEADNYWKNCLEGFEQQTGLSALGKHTQAKAYQLHKEIFTIDEDIFYKLKTIARDNMVTLNTIFQTMWGIILCRYNNIDDVVFGSVVSGRPAEFSEIERMVGLFINTIPVRIKYNDNESFVNLMKKVQQNALQSDKYSYYSLADIQSKSSLKNELLNHIIVFENYPLEGAAKNAVDELNTGFVVENIKSFEQTNYDFNIIVVPSNKLTIMLNYNSNVFNEDIVKRIRYHIENVLTQIVDNIDVLIGEIDILTKQEKIKILGEFDGSTIAYNESKTLNRVFEEQVNKTPNNIAIMFGDSHYTYKQLDEESNKYARLLIQKGTEIGSIIGIMAERSLEMMAGIMGILKAGAAYLPISPDYPIERIKYMLEDSGAKIFMTQDRYVDKANLDVYTINLNEDLRQIKDTSNVGIVNKLEDLAYVIYTSGSTGKPKGTMIEHGSIMNRLLWMQKEYELDEGDTILHKTPFTFDVSVWELFWWSFAGARVCFLEPNGEKDPISIVSAIEKYKITTMHFVPSMLNIFLQHIMDREVTKKLDSLRRVFSSGEALSAKQANLFNELLSKSNNTKLYNLYGPTEAAVDVSYFDCSFQEELEIVPIGKPIDNISLYILDQRNKLQPIGVAGELCISGIGVGRGYLNREELTKKKFVKDPFKLGKRMYRTGDLARWLEDGNIEYLGRIDNQVKIRGYRIELGEVEAQLLKQDSVKEAIVVVKDDANQDKMLCAYIVGAEETDIYELRKNLLKELPDYMVPSFIMKLENIPLTQNGKVDRTALPKPQISPQTEAKYEAPANDIEEKLMEIWTDNLGLERIGVNDNFFLMGGHSLKLMGLASNIHKLMNIEVPLKVLYMSPTIRGIAEYLKEADINIYETIEPVEQREYYPVSSAQKRMYIVNQLKNSDINYNTPTFFLIEGDFDTQRFEWVINQLIRRHESLRTCFDIVEGEIVQKINQYEPYKINHLHSNEAEIDDLIKRFVKPFDLSIGPLLRVTIVEINDNKYVLMYDMHHIISDGASMSVILKEISLLYEGRALPDLRIQYKDFSVWQISNRNSEYMQNNREYWHDIYRGGVPVLNLPLDFPRPSIQEFAGDTISFEIGKSLSDKLKELRKNSKTTMYTILLSIYNILLCKYGGQEDIVVGSPVSGRPHADLEYIIGMFVNMLPIRTQINLNRTFMSFLREVRENFINAVEHQSYQFEDLVDELEIKRDLSRNPIFDTMLVFENQEKSELEFNSLKFKQYAGKNAVSKFDLSLYAYEREEAIYFDIEYSTKLFKKSTVEKLGRNFINIVSQIIHNQDIKLSDIELVTEDEKHIILNKFNNTRREYPEQKTLNQIFEEQVDKTPNNIAVIFGDSQLTYRELNEKSNKLARVLRDKGTKAGNVVGIMVERSLDMMVGIMGILKAGAAYLPIHPNYPSQRINYMLEDSGVKLLLTQEQFMNTKLFNIEMLDLNDKSVYLSNGSNLDSINKSNDLAYVIYTSGSTGKPKGMMIEHHSIINRLAWGQDKYTLDSEDVILQKTPYTFDVSVWELFWWYFGGAKICFLEQDGEKDPEIIAETVEKNNITTIHFVPSMLNIFLEYIKEWEVEERLLSLKQVFASGEALSVRQANLFNKLLFNKNNTKLYNLYGPTETSVEVSYFDCSTGEELELVPIGKPIDNINLYIVDKSNRLQPIGVPGELCISGAGVGRGYINREELTKDKFVLDPFKKGQRMYKSGDLARWLPSGDIEYLGRLDNQVKIRGYRIELGEIEAQLLKQGSIREAIVVVKEDKKQDKMLCAYVVSDEIVDVSIIKNSIKKELPDYMVPAFIIKLDYIPLTQNGKVNRDELVDPQEGLLLENEYQEPTNEVEKELMNIWKEVLGLKRIGINDNFFTIGGHSLKATKFITFAYKRLNSRIPLKKVFENPTIRELAEYIEQNQDDYSSICKVEDSPYYPASSAQKRFFLLYQSKNEDISYNMPFIMQVEGYLDKSKFKTVIENLVERHESLRTTFGIAEGKIVQKVNTNVNVEIEYVEVNENEKQQQIEAFIRPFDLIKGPLIRVRLGAISDNKHIMMIDVHHIICDGVSIMVLISEFVKLYNGQVLPSLRIQYKDFSVWQNEMLDSEMKQNQEKYWLERFKGNIPVLDMPTDYPRPSRKSTEGAKVKYDLDEILTKELYNLASKKGTTIYVVLLTAYNILLSKYSGQQDIVIGTPTAGRTHADLQNIIGLFVNTLAMRNYPTSSKIFSEFLMEVNENTLQALENQEYQFEELVERLGVKIDTSRNPLFDVMFMLQNFGENLQESTDLVFTEYEYQKDTSKFDINLIVFERNSSLHLIMEYSVKLFKEETVNNLINSYIGILKEVIQNPEIVISNINLSQEQKQRIISDFNDDLEF